jgi:type IV secretory pathway VirJ component
VPLALSDAPPVSSATEPGERLALLVTASLEAARGTSALRDLPLAELPAERPGALLAVIYSGDGGWRDIDKQIGEVLAAGGMPVVGVDSLRYFWRRRTPKEVARDLPAILHHFEELWGTRGAVLVGYSFGAGVLPFAVNRLAEAERARVVQVSLLGLAPRAAPCRG